MGCSGSSTIITVDKEGKTSGKISTYNTDTESDINNPNNPPPTKSNTCQFNNEFVSAGQVTINTQTFVARNKNHIKSSYSILEKMGEGSFGKVYKVTHKQTGQVRAMKMINKENVKYQDDEKLFLKEIEVLAKLDHPNIIKVYEYFIDRDFYYIITEFAAGGELYEEISKCDYFDEGKAAVIMEQLLSAVCYLHARNIVHRDLKPENIMLEDRKEGDWTIKIIDFGTANCYEKDNDKKMTMKVGTPYYIAPEVLYRSYDQKCDLWSCGVILFILLSGYPPIDGENDKDIMRNVKKGVFSFDSSEWEDISKEAKDLISKLLTYQPAYRISAEEALKHPWILKNCKQRSHSNRNTNTTDKLPKISAETLKKFTSKQKLQQASIAFLVHQMSTNEVVKNLRNIFKQLDESGDGRLSHEELEKGYKRFFSDFLSEVEFDKLIHKLDQDNSGYIEYEEFLRATMDTESMLTEKNLQMAFDFFDKDGSGKLSADEIKGVLGILNNDQESADLVTKIISEVDTNGDGEVSFDEFKNLMKKSIK